MPRGAEPDAHGGRARHLYHQEARGNVYRLAEKVSRSAASSNAPGPMMADSAAKLRKRKAKRAAKKAGSK